MIFPSHGYVEFYPFVGCVTDCAVSTVLRGRLVHHRLKDAPSCVDKPDKKSHLNISGSIKTLIS
jgi:hypothetical protein